MALGYERRFFMARMEGGKGKSVQTTFVCTAITQCAKKLK
jgi:hypothetical protein